MAVSQTLTVTEVQGSANTSANTSQVRILWESTQTGNSHNDFVRTAKYYVSLNGGTEVEYQVSYTLPQNTTKTIVDVTLTVPHKPDGSGTVRVRTWMDTAISVAVIEKTKTIFLTSIIRASSIISVADRMLGEACSVRWTPNRSCTYRLKFSIGDWSHTTGGLKPVVASGTYTYNGYNISLDAAHQLLPTATQGTMTVALYTYSDMLATKQIGEPSVMEFVVTVPENEATMPSVDMTLSPVTPYEKFSSLYLQGISRVKATFTGEGKYGASIVAYSLQAESGRYTEPDASNAYVSDILAQSGEATIVGFVSDSRWFGNHTIQKINVIAYEAPYISTSSGYNKVICERCKADGTADESGTYLHIKGKRNYTKINTDGIVNTCSVKCRYKPEGGDWSHNSGDGVAVLLGTNTATDEFDVVLSSIVFNPTSTYVVELNIADDTGLNSYIEFSIPSEEVAFHLRDGGGGAAFGKYSITKDLLECVWEAKFHKDIYINGNKVLDFIVEQASSDIWYYRKWYSGKVECWGRRRVSVNISEAWETIFYGSVSEYAYPSGLFTDAPMCQVTAEFGATKQAAWIGIGGESTKDNTPSVFLCRPNNVEASFDILYYAIGN